MKHCYEDVNGIRLHYVQAGSGPLVVLLHGFPQCWYCWRHQIDALAQHYTVVAPDLRGYNETEKPPFLWDYHIKTLMKDVIDLLRVVGPQRAAIVGHDWGGLLAWRLAMDYPSHVERLAVLNMPHPIRFADAMHFNPLQMLRSSYISFFQLPLVPEVLLRADNYALIAQTLRQTAARRDVFSTEDIQFYIDAISMPGALRAALNWYRAYVGLGGNLSTFFLKREKIKTPTMLIWGEKDSFLSSSLVRGTDRYVANLDIRMLPGCSHWVMEEAPHDVNDLLLEFLAGR